MNPYSTTKHFPEEQYQVDLFKWIRAIEPDVVVETGVSSGGTSSQWILKAMDLNKHGRLYSVESECVKPFDHPRWKFVAGFSQEKLAGIYLESGPWDLFLHDSDHEVGCQTFEYEIAWDFTKPGGHIASDDCEWGTPIHFSWRRFVELKGITNVLRMGCIQLFQKPVDSPAPKADKLWVEGRIKSAKEKSVAATESYLARK